MKQGKYKIPFLLRPSGKDYLWGGQRLNRDFEKNIDMSPLAETWECSTHPDGPSFVESGCFKDMPLHEVINQHPEFLGEKHKGKKELPILIKLIDAKDDLSIQVHPNDVYALKNENGQQGKTEMWYVLEAEKEAKLVYGFYHDETKESIKHSINEGSFVKHLQYISVKKDDIFFIEAGTVHAIGAGVLIAEIQENSNLTYRLYDYDRLDKNGKKRELHINKALDVANLQSLAEPKQPLRVLKYRKGLALELLSRCKYFEVYRMIINTEEGMFVNYRADEVSFRVLLCIEGNCIIKIDRETLEIKKGLCVFVPAESVLMHMQGKATFIEVRG